MCTSDEVGLISDGPTTSVFRLATWNLWWMFGDGPGRQVAIRHHLERLRADVIGIQEAWAAPGIRQVQELAATLGLHHVWSPSPCSRYWRRRHTNGDSLTVGNAILSRWPITRHNVTVLSDDDAEDGRTAVLGRIATPCGQLDFCSTQLSSTVVDGSSIRSRQVARLRRWLAATRTRLHAPLVVAGDFNADPDTEEIRQLGGYKTAVDDPDLVLIDAWRYRGDNDPGFTWRRDNPHVRRTGEPWARLDYLLLSPSSAGLPQVDAVEIFGVAPVDDVYASDHAGVVADLRLPRS